MALLCSEADVRQRVQRWVLASFLATDLQNAAAYLVGEPGSTDGLGLITRWSAQFEFEVGYAVALKTETITLDGTGTGELIIPKRYTPIAAIHSLTFSGLGNAITNYGYDAESGRIWLTTDSAVQIADSYQFGVPRLDQPRWPAGRSNITLELRYGIKAVNDLTVIRGAVADRVAADVLIEDRARRDQGLTSKALGDRSESYGKGRWTEEADKLIAAYERVVRNYQSLVTAGV